MSPKDVGLAMDDALRNGLTTIERLAIELETAGGPGIRGTRTFRRLLEGRDERDGKLRSRFEAKMMRIIKRITSDFAPNFEVRWGNHRYFIDFAFPRIHLGIECQSVRWHWGNDYQQKDLHRHRRLTGMGWAIIGFTWDDVVFTPLEVEHELRELLTAQLFSTPTTVTVAKVERT